MVLEISGSEWQMAGSQELKVYCKALRKAFILFQVAGLAQILYVRFSMTNVGTVEPPPAVTLRRAAVERRQNEPDM